MKNFNITQDSLELGKSKCFFSVMKKNNPVVFRFCKFYSKRTLVEGYEKLISYLYALFHKVQDIYYSFPYPYEFCKWLYKNKLYSSSGSAYAINFIFNEIEMVKYSSLKKLKSIIKIWNKHD